MIPSTVPNAFKLSLFYTIAIFLFASGCKNPENKYVKLQGNVFGTTFHIIFQNKTENELRFEIENLFHEINQSLSTYHKNSAISKLNNGLDSIKVNKDFINVFLLAKRIHKNTNGYFDPTIGKTGNVWGFGPKKITREPTQHEIDSLMQYVGFDSIILQGSTIIKKNKNSYLDFNAIAKGYGVDAVGKFLESKGITDYLVEIGGEVKAKGKNTQGIDWSVGIDDPNFDGSRSQQKITRLKNEAIATSGNYRKFRIDSITGKKIAHTLNPKTGSPAQTDLLSVSVISNNSCAEADAYATAFMAMGCEKAKKIAQEHTELKVFFIYLKDDELQTYTSKELSFVAL